MNMDYRKFIKASPEIMLGKPVFAGTRIPVELILRKMSEGMERAEILEAYPSLSREALLAALAYSAEILEREEVLVS